MKYKWALVVPILLAGCASQTEDRTTYTYIYNSIVQVEDVGVETTRGTQQEPQSDLKVDLAYRMEQIMDKISGAIVPAPLVKPPVVVVPPVNPVEPVEPEPTEPVDMTMKYDHYNPDAWRGTGSAIVMCKGEPRMEHCFLNEKRMTLHAAQDKGRDVWTMYSIPKLGGYIICTDYDKKDYVYKISGTGGIQKGDCNTIPIPVGEKIVAFKYAGLTNGDRPTWRLEGLLKIGDKFSFKCGPVSDKGTAAPRKTTIGWDREPSVVKNSDSYSGQMAILISKKHKGPFKASDCSITIY